MMQQMLDDLWTASQDADCLIYHPKAFAGYDIAQKLNIPVFAAHPIPIIAPTGAFTNPILPVTFRNRWLNEKAIISTVSCCYPSKIDEYMEKRYVAFTSTKSILR